MTRKDYPLVSRALREARQYKDRAANPTSFIHGCDAVAVDVANALAQDNPHGFDRERFLRDAGVQS